jgi:hypothetical protein
MQRPGRMTARRRAWLAVITAMALAMVPAIVQRAPVDAAQYPSRPWSANLLTGAKSTFEGGTGGWIGIGGETRLARQSLVKYRGRGALGILRWGKPGPAIAQSGNPRKRTLTRATAGKRYRGDFYVKATTAPRPVAAGITFFDRYGNELDTVIGMYLSDTVAR